MRKVRGAILAGKKLAEDNSQDRHIADTLGCCRRNAGKQKNLLLSLHGGHSGRVSQARVLAGCCIEDSYSRSSVRDIDILVDYEMSRAYVKTCLPLHMQYYTARA